MADSAGLLKECDDHFFLDETKIRKISSVIPEHATKLDENTKLSYYNDREDNAFFETTDLEEN